MLELSWCEKVVRPSFAIGVSAFKTETLDFISKILEMVYIKTCYFIIFILLCEFCCRVSATPRSILITQVA